MSEENVEVVREALDAVNRREIDRYLSHCTDDVALTGPLSGKKYKGPEGIRRYLADIEADVADFRQDIVSLEALGVDRVVGCLRVRGTGRTSRVPIDHSVTNFYDLVDGKISRIRPGFRDRDEALRALGMED